MVGVLSPSLLLLQLWGSGSQAPGVVQWVPVWQRGLMEQPGARSPWPRGLGHGAVVGKATVSCRRKRPPVSSPSAS